METFQLNHGLTFWEFESRVQHISLWYSIHENSFGLLTTEILFKTCTKSNCLVLKLPSLCLPCLFVYLYFSDLSKVICFYTVGAQSVECYQKGIELMIGEKEKREAQEVAAACGGDSGEHVTGRNISDAYVAIAEIYMTDCWLV